MAKEQIHILLVTDDNETQDVYLQYFSRHGFQIEAVDDGYAALERVKEMRPDIVITALLMAKMDGFELLHNLRQNSEMSSIPIIFLSPIGRQEDQNRPEDFGVDDIIIRDTTPLPEVATRIKVLFTSQDYILAIDPKLFDGGRFATDMGLPEDYTSPDGVNGKYVLRVRMTEAGQRKRFEADLISA